MIVYRCTRCKSEGVEGYPEPKCSCMVALESVQIGKTNPFPAPVTPIHNPDEIRRWHIPLPMDLGAPITATVFVDPELLPIRAPGCICHQCYVFDGGSGAVIRCAAAQMARANIDLVDDGGVRR